MIQLKEVEKEIKELSTEWEDFKKMRQAERDLVYNKRRMKEIKNRIPFLRQIKKYLQTNPTPEYIAESHGKTIARIERILNGFVPDKNKTLAQQSKDRQTYEKEYRIPHLRNQVRTLKYLLKSENAYSKS